MVNSIIVAGAANAFLAVAAGAFAAHGLKNMLTTEYINIFKTAADYQMMHGIGLILIGMLNKYDSRHDSKQGNIPNHTRFNNITAIFMLAGIILFSGSLYLLTLTQIKWLGIITPFGGVCFLIAWLLLGFNYLQKKQQAYSG